MNFFKEFKGPILFLGKFLILYLILNLFYGLFVNHYSPGADPITILVTNNTELVLDIVGYETESIPETEKPHVILQEDGRAILSVYEGCNGANVAIIFVSFLLSFGNPKKALLWFVPLGLVIIHFTNLMRIGLLFYVTKNLPHYLYFTHKYFFTAIIYLVVFAMWYIWVARINK